VIFAIALAPRICFVNCFLLAIESCVERGSSRCLIDAAVDKFVWDGTFKVNVEIGAQEIADAIRAIRSEEQYLERLQNDPSLHNNGQAIASLLSTQRYLIEGYIKNDQPEQLNFVAERTFNIFKILPEIDIKSKANISKEIKTSLSRWYGSTPIAAILSEEHETDFYDPVITSDDNVYNHVKDFVVVNPELPVHKLKRHSGWEPISREQCAPANQYRLIGLVPTTQGLDRFRQIEGLLERSDATAFEATTAQDDVHRLLLLISIPPDSLRTHRAELTFLDELGHKLKSEIVGLANKARSSLARDEGALSTPEAYRNKMSRNKKIGVAIRNDVVLPINFIALNISIGNMELAFSTSDDLFAFLLGTNHRTTKNTGLFAQEVQTEIESLALPLAYLFSSVGIYRLPLKHLTSLSQERYRLKTGILSCSFRGMIDARRYAEASAVLTSASADGVKKAFSAGLRPSSEELECERYLPFADECRFVVALARSNDLEGLVRLYGPVEDGIEEFHVMPGYLICSVGVSPMTKTLMTGGPKFDLLL
jgi:hypothetical protein